MTKEAFEGKLNALVPQPDPEITAALFAFGQELGQEEACDGVRELLNSMSFVPALLRRDHAERLRDHPTRLGGPAW